MAASGRVGLIERGSEDRDRSAAFAHGLFMSHRVHAFREPAHHRDPSLDEDLHQAPRPARFGNLHELGKLVVSGARRASNHPSRSEEGFILDPDRLPSLITEVKPAVDTLTIEMKSEVRP